MTLVDTNVLLDVLLAGAEHGDESEERLAAALRAGPVIVNDVIPAELAPVFDTAAALWAALADARIDLVPYPREAVFVAGTGFKRYRQRGGRRTPHPARFHDRCACRRVSRASPHAGRALLPQRVSRAAAGLIIGPARRSQ